MKKQNIKARTEISVRANNSIRNNITRSLNILRINKIDVSYILLSNTRIFFIRNLARVLVP